MRRNPPARWVLPETVDPVTRRCIQIDVPDDPAHIAAFRGALLSLASAYNWADDPAHTAKDVALVWREIIDSHQEWGCGLAIEFYQDACGLYYREVGAETWIQIYDGLECLDSEGAHNLLQGLFDDFLMQAVSDGTVAPGGQQSPTEPPAQGECQTFHVALVANSKWKIPFPISTNDTIAITNASGGATDGAFLWYCADGKSYVLGTCGNNNPYQPSDPLQAGNHMQLIGAYNTTTPVYFDPLTALYNVPSDVTEQEAWIQVNDSELPDNAGELRFDVEICAGGFTHNFDLTSGQHGWALNNWLDGAGEYLAGQGYHNTFNGAYYNLAIGIGSELRTFTKVDITVTRTIAEGPGTGNTIIGNAGGTWQNTDDAPIGTSHIIWTGVQASDEIFIFTGTGGTNQSVIVSNVYVEGRGSDPF